MLKRRFWSLVTVIALCTGDPSRLERARAVPNELSSSEATAIFENIIEQEQLRQQEKRKAETDTSQLNEESHEDDNSEPADTSIENVREIFDALKKDNNMKPSKEEGRSNTDADSNQATKLLQGLIYADQAATDAASAAAASQTKRTVDSSNQSKESKELTGLQEEELAKVILKDTEVTSRNSSMNMDKLESDLQNVLTEHDAVDVKQALRELYSPHQEHGIDEHAELRALYENVPREKRIAATAVVLGALGAVGSVASIGSLAHGLINELKKVNWRRVRWPHKRWRVRWPHRRWRTRVRWPRRRRRVRW